MSEPKKRTQEELDNLKRNWRRDPCWALEDSEGFEAHRKELLHYSEVWKAEWASAAQKHRATLAHKICPEMSDSSGFVLCQLEDCAQWNATWGKCGMLPIPHPPLSPPGP